MKRILMTSLVAIAILAASCKKNTSPLSDPDTSSIENLKVSSTFDWSTTNEINFSIGTSDSRFQNLIHVIYIYDQDPASGGKILAKGSATLIRPFNTKVAFAKATQNVYIVKSAPNGTKIGEKVALTSRNINLSFGSTSITKSTAVVGNTSLSPKVLGVTVTDLSTAVIPDCERSTNEPNITLNKSEVVCFNADKDVTVDIQANLGGTVKLNAPNHTISLRNFNHTNLNIVIGAGTKFALTNGLEIKTNETWTNNGTLEISGKLDLKGVLDNNSSATISNLQINSLGIVNNYCKLYLTDFQADNILNNYGYLISKSTTRINSNGRINLIGGTESGAYFETKDLQKGSNGGRVVGTNAVSLFKVTGSIDNNLLLDAKQTSNSQIVAGNVQLCTAVPNIPSGFFIAPAALGCEAYIAKTDCMVVSNGTAPTTGKDSDGDGVIDEDDDFKDDKTKAYKTYSINYDGGGSTLAFEDNWPAKGDYDLNDVVLTYRYLVVTNAENKVVEVNANYSLIATGADFNNGAAVQFPLTAGQAKLTKAPAGVFLESNQDSVVLVLFDNSRKAQATGNTITGVEKSPVVNYDITFEVKDGPEMKNFGAVTFNPFIWNGTNGYGRMYETHLFGKTPTKLAGTGLFDTKDDYSKSNNKYYSTKERLPWVIEVPIANFGYPIEGKRIDQAYTNFVEWATSSGNNSQEWYKILSGGANTSLIYPVK